MVLPGTVWQVPLIKKIKSLGFKVAVVHPTKDAPGFEYADKVINADILDQETCLESAKVINACAIMSDECDIATPTLAYVSSKAGLPSQGENIARLYTDKSLMRAFCEKHNLPFPAFKVCVDVNEAIDFFNALDGKMVIKPIDANSSRGVYTVTNVDDLSQLFRQSLSYSHHHKAVICERYISGAEFSVDGIMMPDGHHSLAISEKQQFSYNKNLDQYLYFSYYSNKYDYDRLREINNKYVELSGLPFGFTHAEYRYENGEFYLLEIGARGGGNLISALIVPALTGIDNYKILIDMFTTGSTVEHIDDKMLINEKVAVLCYFDTTEEGGVVKGISGTDFLNNNKNILTWNLSFKIGDKIRRPTDGGNRIGYYIAVCDNPDDMKSLQTEINNTFKIIYE